MDARAAWFGTMRENYFVTAAAVPTDCGTARKTEYQTKEKKMTKSTFKKYILQILAWERTITFPKLLKYLAENTGTTVDGDHCISMGRLPNGVLWTGVIQELSDAITEMANDKEVNITPCSLLDYLEAGQGLDMPVVDRDHPATGFETPTWVPAQLSMAV